MIANSSPPRRATVSVSRTQRCSRRADLAQQRVAGVVAERVVDVLEVIEVEQQQPDLVAGAARAGERGVEPVVEQRPVGQAGEAVVVGEVPKALLDVAPLGDVLADPEQGDDLAVVVDLAARLGPDMPLRPVRRPDTELEGRGRPRAHDMVEPGADALPVVGVDEAQDDVEPGLEARRVEPEDAVHLGRPVERLAADRPAPVAEAGEPLGLLQLTLARAQRRLDALRARRPPRARAARRGEARAG